MNSTLKDTLTIHCLHGLKSAFVSVKGLEILAFPCNQFGEEEPGSNDEISELVCTRFRSEFPIFDKVTRTMLYLLLSKTWVFLPQSLLAVLNFTVFLTRIHIVEDLPQWAYFRHNFANMIALRTPLMNRMNIMCNFLLKHLFLLL